MHSPIELSNLPWEEGGTPSGMPNFDSALFPTPPQSLDEEEMYDFNGGERPSLDDEFEEGRAPTFYDNLAENNQVLDSLCSTLLQSISDDKQSRSSWENTFNLGLKYLGIKVEEFRNSPFALASGAFDSILLSSLLNFYCVARAELLPAGGPVSMEIMGVSDEASEETSERVTAYMNFYLTHEEKGYYPDSERLLMYTGLCGCGFRKVYQDPVSNKPFARFVNPLDIIINSDTTSLLASTRITEVQYLTRKEILLKQQSGYFINFDVPEHEEGEYDQSNTKKTIEELDGIRKNSMQENNSLFKFYEVHLETTPDEIEKNSVEEENAVPRPYIITIFESGRKIVAAYRNWEPEDPIYTAIKYYVNYYFLPGFGIYGMGLVHIAGSNSITMTNILRQAVNAGMLKMIPAGITTQPLREEDNNKPMGPGEFRYIPADLPASNIFSPLPFGEPDPTLIALRTQLREETKELVATTTNQIPDIGANAPVGTVLAQLDMASKLQSTILRSLHTSLGQELQLLYKLFGKYLPEEPYPFAVPGKEMAIMRADFSDRFHIIPVSDPNLLTSTHRLLRADAELRLAQSAPELHDMREFYVRIYKALGIDALSIDKLIPPPPAPQALDAVTENALLMGNQPVVVATFQDDEAHMETHTPLLTTALQQNNIALYVTVARHNQEHKCIRAWKELQRQQMFPVYQRQMQENILQGMPAEMAEQQMMQEMKNMQFPPLSPDEIKNIIAMPVIQNMVSMKDAEEARLKKEQEQAAAAEQIDPNKVMLAQIDQQREAAHLKADADKLKVEAEAFKAQLSHEAEISKTENQLAIATEKNEVDLTIAADKHAIERMRLEEGF